MRLTIILLLSFLSCQLWADGLADTYRLGAGDLISIKVYDEPNLSLDNVKIADTGNISFPFLGNINVLGKTPKEVEEKIVMGLKGPYLVNPNVTVLILEYRPFYVIGEVKRPGSYSFQPGLTVARAISIAGGFTERASKNSIYIEHDFVKANSAKKKSSEKSVELDNNVNPGDVITVKQSFF